jgi:outer membrane cobalamin receptor
MLKVNDTDQVRIPEYVAVISWQDTFKGVDYRVKYSGQFDRTPGLYDFLPEGQEYLDDLKKLNIYVGKQFASGVNIYFTIDNVTDEEVEVLPYYGSQGREYQFTVQYNW